MLAYVVLICAVLVGVIFNAAIFSKARKPTLCFMLSAALGAAALALLYAIGYGVNFGVVESVAAVSLGISGVLALFYFYFFI